jgi:hypothetical protein
VGHIQFQAKRCGHTWQGLSTSGLCRPNAKALSGNAAAERNGEILPRSPGLRWRHVRGRAETFAADHGTVAVLLDPKAATVFHNQIEVVTVANFGIDAAADDVGNLLGAKHVGARWLHTWFHTYRSQRVPHKPAMRNWSSDEKRH